jgi:hypothetical protein
MKYNNFTWIVGLFKVDQKVHDGRDKVAHLGFEFLKYILFPGTLWFLEISLRRQYF